MSVLRRTLALMLLLPLTAAAQERGYYRQPALHGDRIVFVAEGDLWTVPATGGPAVRLTTHPGAEFAPAISADGRRVAFTANYEGPREVYVMALDGGLPQRLTYGDGGVVTGWTPDGRVLVRTDAYATLPNQQLVALDPGTGARHRIPLAQAADGSWDADGMLYFTRFAEQGSRTKRYRGGTAQDIWRFGDGMAEAAPLTPDFAGTSRTPMWWNGRVYFESDRDGTMNIWSMAPDGSDLRQHTRHDGWDVKGASPGSGRIVYQLGADLRVLDLATGADRMVPVTLVSDFDQLRERWIDDPMEYLDDWSLSPDGARVALVARGRVFVAPVEAGRFVQVTRHSGVRYRVAEFLPDGASLAVLSDESGEVEWWTLPANGLGEPRQVTTNGRVVRMGGVVSPDGSWIVDANHDQELWLTEVATGRARQIDFSPQWGYELPVWSPDSRWIIYGKPADNTFMQLFLYNVADGEATPLTTDRYNSRDPVWSPDGRWIYFRSDRHLRSSVFSPWGTRQPEPYFEKTYELFAVPVGPGLRFPFAPPDELTGEAVADDGMPAVDLDGITTRLLKLPVPPGNYFALTMNADRLFWLQGTGGGRADLQALALEHDAEPETLVENVRGYEVSRDGKQLAVRTGDAFHVVAASAGAGVRLNGDNRVDLSGWAFSLDPREDFRQLFVDSWRLERDYFYDPDMHGVDWEAMLQKYLPLVDRVRDRAELADLQAQLASELSTLHTYVYGGDFRDGPTDIDNATLGARLERAPDAGGWRVAHVYRSDPDLPDERAPLARYGVDVGAGDVITAINGVSTLSVPHPHALLRNQAGRQVRLAVRPRGGGAERHVIVRPITASADDDLRYDEWEYTRRLAVDSASDERIGYVHLRAMGSRNVTEWYREFYPVFNRQGLIIDVRHNRGGNIESWILEKLIRQAWMYWQPRVGDPYWNMQYAFRGHMVVLVDERTASDGEAFAEGFRRLGLGQVIGTRTWGGEIWLTSSNRLVDRGIVTAAEFGVYGPDGSWLIENHGVDPDLVVDNLPHATFQGEDAQLAAAIAHLERLIREDPRPVPPHAPYPDKSVPGNRRDTRETAGSR